MEQPEGFVLPQNKDKVCYLKKSLYVLKQAPRQWNKRFDRFMTEERFVRSVQDPCVYLCQADWCKKSCISVIVCG